MEVIKSINALYLTYARCKAGDTYYDNKVTAAALAGGQLKVLVWLRCTGVGWSLEMQEAALGLIRRVMRDSAGNTCNSGASERRLVLAAMEMGTGKTWTYCDGCTCGFFTPWTKTLTSPVCVNDSQVRMLVRKTTLSSVALYHSTFSRILSMFILFAYARGTQWGSQNKIK